MQCTCTHHVDINHLLFSHAQETWDQVDVALCDKISLQPSFYFLHIMSHQKLDLKLQRCVHARQCRHTVQCIPSYTLPALCMHIHWVCKPSVNQLCRHCIVAVWHLMLSICSPHSVIYNHLLAFVWVCPVVLWVRVLEASWQRRNWEHLVHSLFQAVSKLMYLADACMFFVTDVVLLPCVRLHFIWCI